MKKSTIDEFIVKAQRVHGDIYDYSNAVYNGNNKKLEIRCKTHGVFWMTAGNHLAGKKCKICSKLTNPSYTPKPIVNVIKDFQKVHGNKYTYIGILDYVNSSTPITMLCNTTGYVFKQAPGNHLSGKGCPCCSTSGFNGTAPAILYYLSVNNGEAYKIGITNRTVQDRFNNGDLARIKILDVVEYPTGTDAQNEETRIKQTFNEYLYKGPNLLSSGNTELFTIDILNKDINV